MKRNDYSLQMPTKLAQKLPQYHEDKITAFQKFVIRRRKEHKYRMVCIGYMDETPVNMDMVDCEQERGKNSFGEDYRARENSLHIIKAFKKCCISNAMDGMEDDILWDHEIENADRNEGDDPLAMEEDPQNVQISFHDVSTLQELLSGDHDKDKDKEN